MLFGLIISVSVFVILFSVVISSSWFSSVLLLDILKGYLAVRLVDVMNWVWPYVNTEDAASFVGFHADDYMTYAVVFGVMSVIGHLLPMFAKFKGGKGVATLFGMIIALDPLVAMTALGVFAVTLITPEPERVDVATVLTLPAVPVYATP